MKLIAYLTLALTLGVPAILAEEEQTVLLIGHKPGPQTRSCCNEPMPSSSIQVPGQRSSSLKNPQLISRR